jgi:hypothetical protein
MPETQATHDGTNIQNAGICRKVYSFHTQVLRDMALDILTSAYGETLRSGLFSAGFAHTILTPYFLTLYFDPPADVDARIQAHMGYVPPKAGMYITQGDSEDLDRAFGAPGPKPKGVLINLPMATDETGGLYAFLFHGYGVPTEVYRNVETGYALKIRGDEEGDAAVWYINSNGYGQKLDTSRPPHVHPTPVRVLLIPQFPE